MRIILVMFVAIFSMPYIAAQETEIKEEKEKLVIDSLYREDQLYFGVTYNIFGDMPSGMSQYGFSAGFHVGIIRDIPVNKERDRAIGVGIGFSTNSFNNNLFIDDNYPNSEGLEIIADGGFDRNRMVLQVIEMPIEFRWRTSTPESYKFWRIYPGFKFGYVVTSKSKFTGNGDSVTVKNIENLNRWQYGLTLSAGYASWNVHLYYGLNAIFNKEATLNGKSVDFKMMKIGLMFYML